jgi:hypothetical protein
VNCGDIIVRVARIGGKARNARIDEARDHIVMGEVRTRMHDDNRRLRLRIGLGQPEQPPVLAVVSRLEDQVAHVGRLGLPAHVHGGASPIRLRDQLHREASSTNGFFRDD